MDAWRTSCPRLSIWEDALSDRLILVSSVSRAGPANVGSGQSRSAVELTTEGRSMLDQVGQPWS